MASENETVEAAIDAVRKMIHDCPAIKGGLGQFEYQLKANGAIDRIEAAHRREVDELRECLKEAITQYCTSRPHEFDDGFGNCENFKNGSCVSSECWRFGYINKWRKALEGANDEDK